MAVKFISIVDKGSALRMTIAGWMVFLPVAALTLFLMRDTKLYAVIAVVVEWVAISIIFTSHPQRVMASLLYSLREGRIIAVKDHDARLWTRKNEPLLDDIGIEIYKGEKSRHERPESITPGCG